MDFCKKIISFSDQPHTDLNPEDNAITMASNDPIGKITCALVTRWRPEELFDNQGILDTIP